MGGSNPPLLGDHMRLNKFLNIVEGTEAQVKHSAKQMTKSEGGEISKTIGKINVHFDTILQAMEKDGFGMEALRVAVQYEDMIRMIANLYGMAEDHLVLPQRRYEK